MPPTMEEDLGEGAGTSQTHGENGVVGLRGQVNAGNG